MTTGPPSAAGPESGGGAASAQRLWRHPHVSGAIVLRHEDGRRYLLLERYGMAAWARRSAWDGDGAHLVPLETDCQELLDLLGRLGYAAAPPARPSPSSDTGPPGPGPDHDRRGREAASAARTA